jgi:hypothetical protein
MFLCDFANLIVAPKTGCEEVFLSAISEQATGPNLMDLESSDGLSLIAIGWLASENQLEIWNAVEITPFV